MNTKNSRDEYEESLKAETAKLKNLLQSLPTKKYNFGQLTGLFEMDYENRQIKHELDRMSAENTNVLNTEKNLQQELKCCTEELERERRDRKLAQSKIEELEQELRIVHRQLDQFQSQQMKEINARRQAALQYYRDEYKKKHPEYENVPLVGRGDLIDGDGPDDDDEDGYGCDTVDAGAHCTKCVK